MHPNNNITMTNIISDYIRLARPTHWIKNIFVFIPLFFGGNIYIASDLSATFLTFLAFCFASSSIYCINDIVDAKSDRQHPTKKVRPVASGRVSIAEAYSIMVVLGIIALMLLTIVPMAFNSFHRQLIRPNCLMPTLGIVILYFVTNIGYCLKMKQYAIVDVCLIAVGYVMRIVAGGICTDIALSKWIVLMTFLLTLFLAFTKRRDDVLIMKETGKAPRKNTSRYNLTFINQSITISGSVMIVCYIMYTVSPEVTMRFGNDYLYLTSILVVVGLLRYIQITVVYEKSGDPVKVIFTDHAIQLILIAWIVSFLVVIYL